MPNHIRQRLRARAATLLTGLATTGARVFPSQYYALAADELPCLLIYTHEEDSSTPPPRCHPGEIRRVITLTIEGVAAGTANLADTLDQIAKEVETQMATDFTLNHTCKETQLLRTALTTRATDAPQPAGAVVLTWQCVTTTLEGVTDSVTF
jgi:hypothetical protein